MERVRKRLLNCAVLLAALWAFFVFSGFTVSGEGTLKTSGKGELTLTVESDCSYEELRADIDGRLNFYNYKSGDSDMLTLKSLSKTSESVYEVTIRTRRIDKIQAYGSFDWKDFSDYTVPESENRELLERFAVGNLSCTVAGYYNGREGKITVPRTSRLTISPRDSAGKEMEIERLFENGGGTIFLFRLLDIEHVTSIKITLPGKIKYYAGNDISVTGSTVEIRPSVIQANVTYFESDSDTPLSENRDIGVMAGYVVFDKDMSPVLKGVLIGLAVAVVAGVTALLLYCRKVGKKIIADERKTDKKYT